MSGAEVWLRPQGWLDYVERQHRPSHSGGGKRFMIPDAQVPLKPDNIHPHAPKSVVSPHYDVGNRPRTYKMTARRSQPARTMAGQLCRQLLPKPAGRLAQGGCHAVDVRGNGNKADATGQIAFGICRIDGKDSRRLARSGDGIKRTVNGR